MKTTFLYSLYIIMLWSLPLTLLAQPKDTLAPFREFIAISKGYQQWPLYMELELQQATNYPLSKEDTAIIKATFYITAEASYIRFGEVEQLIADSLALLVSDQLHQMILYTNARTITAQMKAATGFRLPDSSLVALGKKYTPQTKDLAKDVSSITLISRQALQESSLPKESIELQWDTKTKAPLQITTTSRTLLPLEESDYHRLSNQPTFTNQLLKTHEGAYYLVKEQSAIYSYKKVLHPADLKIPIEMKERIVKNEQGTYEVVKNYETYRLTIH